MKFPRTVQPYLTGEEFSNALRIEYQESNCNAACRAEFLCNLVAGKRVLHIGFADHFQLLKKKSREGSWLHAQLVDVAEFCVGVDIDERAVAYCREVLNFDNLYCHNIVEDDPLEAIAGGQWDIAVLGEVIEHIPNPVSFLKSLRMKYGSCIGKVVITAPNAWELSNLINIRKCAEFINSDHRFWFTPYTLSKIAADAGLQILDMYFVNAFPETRIIRRLLQSRYPMLKETLVGLYRYK